MAILVSFVLVLMVFWLLSDEVGAPSDHAGLQREVAAPLCAVASLAETFATPLERTDARPAPAKVLAADAIAAGRLEIVIYPVKDLVFDAGVRNEPFPHDRVSDLVVNLKQATDPSYWLAKNVELRGEDSGLLWVRAELAMQARVAKALAGLRASRVAPPR